MGLALICMTSLCAYIGIKNTEDTTRGQAAVEVITTAEESLDAKPPSVRNMESAKTEQTASEAAESTKPETDEAQTPTWQISVCPDMPEPYIEVLKQYESYLNACATATDVDSVKERLLHGEWKYVFYEIGIYTKEANPGDSLCYALKDLTGDGFPELIIAKYASEAYPYAVYNYSEEKGVKMFEVSSYFSMLFYETGIMEIDSAGAGYSTITYLQYQEDMQDWAILDKTAVNRLHDSNNPEYFKGIPGESGDPEEPITEAEYNQLAEKYAAEPIKLKWNPLVYGKTTPWYSYEEVMSPDLPDAITFITSRGGQGFHPWIYREASYIMHDYGKRVGYDFISDHWTVEHIWPVEGGYYNILLSQNNHDVFLNLLCQPGPVVGCEDRKYVILYAQYENGEHKAGYDDAISYDSQLEWIDYDFYDDSDCGPLENPFGDLYESSIYHFCHIVLHQYEQETDYDGEWQMRQIFGRAPFWDYLVESENGFLWICTTPNYYSYVSL